MLSIQTAIGRYCLHSLCLQTRNKLNSIKESFLFFSFFFYYSYVHTRLGSFLPPASTPSLTTHSAPSLSPAPIPNRNYFALISNFVVERV
jgi:hypothetical protein